MIICQFLLNVSAHKSRGHRFKNFQCYSGTVSVHGGVAENKEVATWKVDPKGQ